ARGHGEGRELNQLGYPQGIFISEKQNIFIADWRNHRIVEWKLNEEKGKIIAGGSGWETIIYSLNRPTDVIVDEENRSLIVADQGSRRVIRWWFDQSSGISRFIPWFNQNRQEIVIEDIWCYGIAKDKFGFLYVSNELKNEVRRWKIEETKEKEGTLVAGGNGCGNEHYQLHHPSFIFVDDEQSIYISDRLNHRVMKWRKDVKVGVVVAGGNGKGNKLNQLNYPQGILVKDFGQIYVADCYNHRIMRWCEGKEEGEIVVGGNEEREELNQLSFPRGLSFDVKGNLYVADKRNHRIARFDLIL
ncbi:unnamed protein product, partial [Adineta ricciae]